MRSVFKIPSECEHVNSRAGDAETTQCGYCGSISAKDAIRFLTTPGTMFSGSDWKYGWPHKFYIQPINPDKDRLDVISSESGPSIVGDHPNDVWTCFAHHTSFCPCPREVGITGFWSRQTMGHHERLWFKFYNNHLEWVEEPDFQAFAVVAGKCFGITFKRDPDGRVMYACPRTSSAYGYQLSGIVDKNGEPNHDRPRGEPADEDGHSSI